MAERRAPSVRARQLARELRRLRQIAGRTGEETANALGWSSAKISRLESADTRARPTDLRALLDYYGVEEEQRDQLLALTRHANDRGWWDAYPDLGNDYASYISLEVEAHTLHCYSAMSIHGLLQTEDYARAVIGAGPAQAPGVVQRRVQVRMRRQNRLRDDPPIVLKVVLDEAALRRRVGGPEAMRTQLRHLLELAEMPNVTIQVMPFEQGAHPSMSGAFITLKSPYPANDVVYLELETGATYVENDVDVHRYSVIFNELQARSLSGPDSLAFIRRVATEDRPH